MARVTVFSNELLTERSGRVPILRTMSEIAGRLVPRWRRVCSRAPMAGARCCRGYRAAARRGVHSGAGEVGFNAARAFAGIGAQVTVLESPIGWLIWIGSSTCPVGSG